MNNTSARGGANVGKDFDNDGGPVMHLVDALGHLEHGTGTTAVDVVRDSKL